MISNIVSPGETEAEIKILELAIRYKINSSGYTSKDTFAGTGSPSLEMFNLEYVYDKKKADIKNIKNSDGLLYFSSLEYPDHIYSTLNNYCLEYKIPSRKIFLKKNNIYEISDKICSWIIDSGISSLMVKTEKDLKQEDIENIISIFESVIYMVLIKTEPSLLSSPIGLKVPDNKSKSHCVSAVAEDLLKTVSLKDRVIIANMTEYELPELYLSLGLTVLSKYYWPKNNLLFEDCVKILCKSEVSESEIAEIILKTFWKNLRKTHKIRVVTDL
ncbi:MAG: YpsA SLOG family protein [Thermodesulfobacteriota bacterium]